MQELSSAEFRKSFARLTAPVTVTVHGHPIGTYIPAGADVKIMQRQDGGRVLEATIYGVDGTIQTASAPFVSSPVRAWPKPSKRKG